MATSFQAQVHQTFEDSPVSLMGAKWVQDASGTAESIASPLLPPGDNRGCQTVKRLPF